MRRPINLEIPPLKLKHLFTVTVRFRLWTGSILTHRY